MANNIKVKGLNELTQKLNTINRKLKSYDGNHKITLPFSQDEWDKMSLSQQRYYIEKEKNKFVNDMIKNVFN
jgi:hypothetical protein